MPAHKKTMSKVAQSASNKNKTVVAQLGAESIFARVNSNLGSYFRLTVHDGEKTIELLGSPRGLFKQKKAQIRFARDDIVVLSSMPSRASEISEIIALLGKKDAQQLYKDGHIHKSVYQAPPAFGGAAPPEDAEDDFFDYTGVVEEDEKAAHFEASGGKGRAAAESDDIDIDAI
jgi:hypothetical protein